MSPIFNIFNAKKILKQFFSRAWLLSLLSHIEKEIKYDLYDFYLIKIFIFTINQMLSFTIELSLNTLYTL